MSFEYTSKVSWLRRLYNQYRLARARFFPGDYMHAYGHQSYNPDDDPDAPPAVTPCLRRRADLLIVNGGSYTKQEWRDLCAQYGFRCLRCKRRKPLAADHIIPV